MPNRSPVSRRPPVVLTEPLERRSLLSTVLSNGVLTVDGLATANQIKVQATYTAAAGESVAVDLNGETDTYPGPITQVVVNGGDGNDTIFVAAETEPAGTVGGTLPTFAVYGQGGDDALTMGFGSGTLDGGDGDDTLTVDELDAGRPTDYATLVGGAGNDTLLAEGNVAADLIGGDGDDQLELEGVTQPCTVAGGAGTDTAVGVGAGALVVSLDGLPDSTVDAPAGAAAVPATFGSDVENAIAGGAQSTTIALTGNAGPNVLQVLDSPGPATVNGGAGDDTLVGYDPYGTDGQTTFIGGPGTDTADFSADADAVSVYLGSTQPSGTAAQIAAGHGDTFDATVENVMGGSGADLIYGSPAANVLQGNGGDDTIVGDGGPDSLIGGDGDDTLVSTGVPGGYGGVVEGDAGNDTLYAADHSEESVLGGDGTDTAYVDPTDTTVGVETVHTAAAAPAGRLAGTTYGTAGSYGNSGNTVAKATDGNVATYFDAAASTGAFVAVDLGSAQVVSQIGLAPRSGYASRMVGGTFQASDTADFSADVIDAYTVTAVPAAGLTMVPPTTTAADRYWRYLGPSGGHCNVAEFELFGAGPAAPTYAALTGTASGSAAYGGGPNTFANAVDGNLSTFFDSATATAAFVALDLGTPRLVTEIAFAPRSGYAARMVGGTFQASDTADFSAGVVTAYTITAGPPSGRLTTVSLSTPVADRYWRYVGPTNGYGNIAEFQLLGY